MNIQCPILLKEEKRIELGHGGGGYLSHELLRNVFKLELGDSLMHQDSDSTPFELNLNQTTNHSHLVMTTDSYVVDPIFFSGGDIGKLAIVGSINDISVMGCIPKAISLAFIIEEGFLISDLRRILRSIRKELNNLNLKITCGDTKVVPRGKADKIYINTSAIGLRASHKIWGPSHINIGDRLIVSRDIGCHGLTILNERNNLGLSTNIKSDCNELLSLTLALIQGGIDVHCARDLTRGGLVSALVELAESSFKCIEIEDSLVPRSEEVQSACELLGLDPFMIANEGTGLYFISESQAESAIEIMKKKSQSEGAKIIGAVIEDDKNGKAILRLPTGLTRKLRLPQGELLPRIC